MNTKKLITLSSLFFVSSVSFSQTTINTSSHSATINGIVYDYSIGEMVLISTEKTSNLIVTQGQLQPLISSNKINDENVHSVSNLIDYVSVYPNPTQSILNIELIEKVNASIQLYDALGKIVLEQKIQAGKNTIDLFSYATGNYYLVVTTSEGEKPISFKIQKTK